MLDALSVADGQRVMEIGTGTGWNTALLSERLGSEHVVSVEVDEHLAREASKRLYADGYAPEMWRTEPRGTRIGAPYDRVIATCSIGRVPESWIAQTMPGGVIVAPWGPVYGGEAVARLTVGDDGTASGPFVGFVRLHAAAGAAQEPAAPQRLHRRPGMARRRRSEHDGTLPG